MILLRSPISYQLVIAININIKINIAIFAYQYFLINALSSSDIHGLWFENGELQTKAETMPVFHPKIWIS